MMPLAQDVARFLGEETNSQLVSLAEQHVPIVTAFVRAYTRGNGFDVAGWPSDDLAAVIVTATARTISNPSQVVQSSSTPHFTTTYARWDGFNLMERAVLNLYRRRTA